MNNKLYYLLTLWCLFFGTGLFAQQDWPTGYSALAYVDGLATDAQGNVYFGWNIQGLYAMPGAPTAISDSSGQSVITSYSCDGVYRWSKQFGVGPSTWGHNIRSTATVYGLDSSGGIYVTGTMTGGVYGINDTFYVGDTAIANEQIYSLYIAKFDTSRNYQWIRVFIDTFSALTQSLIYCLHADVMPNGDSHFLIILPNGVYANGAFTATYPPGNDVYIMKYDKNGHLLGVKHVDMSYSVTRGSLIYLSATRSQVNGNYYFAGNLIPGVYPDTLRLGDTIITSGGGEAGPDPHVIPYVSQFDSSGNFMWVTKGPGTHGYNSLQFFGAPAVDNLGNVYVTGQSPDGDSLGSFVFANAFHNLYQVPILIKLSPTGEIINGVNGDVPDNSVTAGTAVSFNNGVVGVSGIGVGFNWGDKSISSIPNLYNIFLARFNAADLSIMDLQDIHATGIGDLFPPKVLSMENDDGGNFYIFGNFPGALYMPHDTLYNQEAHFDGFAAKYGFDDCNCNRPVSGFSFVNPGFNTPISFAYNGSTPVDSVLWNFGDGSAAIGTHVSHSFSQDGNYTVCATAYSNCGSNMYCQDVSTIPTGIPEIPGFEEIQIYPNPASQAINITHVAAGTELVIYNLVGTKVLQAHLTEGQNRLDIGRLSPGVYLMRFSDKEGRQGMTKFVKE